MFITKINEKYEPAESQISPFLFYLILAVITGVVLTLIVFLFLIKRCGADIETSEPDELRPVDQGVIDDLPGYNSVVSQSSPNPPCYAQAVADDKPPEYSQFALPEYPLRERFIG